MLVLQVALQIVAINLINLNLLRPSLRFTIVSEDYLKCMLPKKEYNSVK